MHRQCRLFFARAYATNTRAFVPPSQLHDIRPNPRHTLLRNPPSGNVSAESETFIRPPDSETGKRQPESSSFWTGKSVLYDNMIRLQSVNSRLRATLKSLNLLPLPAHAQHGLVTTRPVWKGVKEMSTDFNNELTNSSHRKVLVILNEMYGHYRIAISAGYTDLATMILNIVSIFESGEKKRAMEERGTSKKGKLDQFGRSYSLGRRKTSSARVWMIGVRKPEADMFPESKGFSLAEAVGVQVKSEPPKAMVTTSTILVNNIPLAQYFPLPADRERIVRPLKLAGVLGRFNVFTLVRGGGTTGQSGAIAHGISKGILIHDPKHERILKKAKLTKRDPRMVERKKPGLLKARKARAWVRR